MRRKYWAGFSALAMMLFLMSCAYEEPYGYDYYPPPAYGYYAYDYYPDIEVYYYPRTHIFWWRDHDRWVSGRHVPSNIELGEHVRVDLDSRQPWRHHDEVVRRYPRGGHFEAPRPQPRPEGRPGMEGEHR
jgi:hypothetical protein